MCNLRALVRLMAPMRLAAKRRAVGASLSPWLLRSVADELANASMTDPRHVPTLKNLATLFEVLGDGERALLASRLAAEAEAEESASPVATAAPVSAARP